MSLDIGIVVHHFDRSEGTGGYAVELATRFAREHRVTIYAAGVRTTVPDGVRVIHVPALRGRAYATILSFPLAFAAVRKHHDIVHAQGWVAYRADVVTAHIVLGAWLERARAAGVRSAAGERWLGDFVSRREATLYRRNAGTVIAPSRQARSDIARLYDRSDGVRVVPHGFPTGVDLTPWPSEELKSKARAQFGIPEHTFVAIYVGDARKGLDPALDAIAATPGAHLLVLSGTPSGPYRTKAQGLGIAERVHWAGYLRDPGPAYSAADVLLHPTIYDTFALVVAEAMARALPVIVSRSAGVAELIEHEVSGWLLDAGSATESATALTTLMKDPARRKRLGDGGRAVAARRSWDDVATETLAVYRTVLPR